MEDETKFTHLQNLKKKKKTNTYLDNLKGRKPEKEN